MLEVLEAEAGTAGGVDLDDAGQPEPSGWRRPEWLLAGGAAAAGVGGRLAGAAAVFCRDVEPVHLRGRRAGAAQAYQ